MIKIPLTYNHISYKRSERKAHIKINSISIPPWPKSRNPSWSSKTTVSISLDYADGKEFVPALRAWKVQGDS